ncbi:MAG TPA: methyltransferase domain-containing protein [Pirellulales bacterium]|nr:methyltransferase domain-containing protein [Pirellulales bacterium]
MPDSLSQRLLAAAARAKRAVRRPAVAWRRRRVAEALRARQRPLRLHLGCGHNYLPGWVNIDLNRNLKQLDLRWNLADGLPVADASCELIYSEHLIEHLPVDRAVALFRDCRRALVPQGVIRVAMPSLEHLVAKYASPDWRDQEWLRWPAFQFVNTRAEMLNLSFRSWGHRWLYDREELHRRLAEAGFGEISDVAWGESFHEGLRELETRRDSLLICEAKK